MKICAVSDLHGCLPEIPSCDLLLIAGDLSPIRISEPDVQRAWMNSRFAAWLRSVPAAETVWIAGNHDTSIWKRSIGRKLKRLPGVTYLQDAAVTINDLKIYGSPWTRGLGIGASWWAFDLLNVPGGESPFAAIPADTDIVLTHSPPYGIGDLVLGGDRVGSEDLYQRLLQIKPRLAVSGHIHEDYGVRRLHGAHRLTSDPETIVANAALLDEHYRLVPERQPLLFEF
jgi:Icc-related predicted phosphoesterase